MANVSDIPIEEGPVDPRTGTYSFVLPTRFNDDETNVTIQFPATVSRADALADIRTSFPRNSADTQVQKMTDPDWANKITPEDYLQYKKDEDKYPTQKVDYYHIMKDAVGDLLGAAGNIAVEGSKAAWNASPIVQAMGLGDQRMAARHAWNVVEAGMQGNERLAMLAGLIGLKLEDFFTHNPFKDSESSIEADLNRVRYVQEMGKVLAARKEGQLVTEGNVESPVFGNLVTKPEGVPAATKADVEASNSMSNLLDVTMMIPGAAFAKVGEVASNTMFKYVMPEVLINAGLKTGFAASKVAGSALDATSKYIFNRLTGFANSVAEGAVTDAGKAVANYAAKGALYGGLFYGPGGKLIGMSLTGKALKAVGEVGGAIVEGLEKGSVRAALTELSENEFKAATIRNVARSVSAIVPPDTATNAMKSLLDSAVNVAVPMGGLGALTAWASNDDPIKGFKEGMASGFGAGLVFGAVQAPFHLAGLETQKLANLFQNDILGRPKEQAFSVTQPSGITENVSFGDLQGRIDLFNRTDLTDRQKAMIISLAQGHERAGGRTIFVDGSPESMQKLDDIGFAGAKGVHTFDSADGRSTILIVPDKIDAASAAEEVMHSLFTENIRKEVHEGVSAGLKNSDPNAWVDEINAFGERYAAELEAAGHVDRAAQMRDDMVTAKDPTIPVEDKLGIMDNILNEYISNYVGAAVHGMKPEVLMQGFTKNLWDKVWDKTVSNLLSVFDFTKSGLTKDPIKGHFFDEKGKRVLMPELESIVGRFVDAVREGRDEIYSKHTVDGAHYVDVRGEKPYRSYEDFVDGKPTTYAQKKQLHKQAYEQNISAVNPESVVIATPEAVETGMFAGNLTGVKNKRVLFSRGLPEDFFVHLANQEVNGVKVYSNEQIQALRGLNESLSTGHIVMLDAWHDIKRTKGDRTDVYYGRTNRPFLPISWQQTETGGLLLNGIDIGRVWNQMRYFAKHEPKLRVALQERGISTLAEALPYIQTYFDNYSSGAPVPAASLRGFNETMRDGISRALNIKNRQSYKAADEARFVNEHTFDSEGFPAQPKPVVEVNGVKREVNRDRVSIQSIRTDRIMGLNDFMVNGFNVPIKYDPEMASNLIRANFAPKATSYERLPNGEILTDKTTGDRIIAKPNGKATLMQGERKSIHANVEEAVAEADKRSVAAAKKRASFSISSREDMPEGPVFTREQALERINSAPDWDFASMLKDEQKNAKKIERTYNRFLTSDVSAQRFDALNVAADTISNSVGVNIDKTKFPFFTEKGEKPYFYKERGQLIGQAYPELADLFALGDMEAKVESKKMMGMSWDALTFDAPGQAASKHGQKMSELTDKIYNQFKGAFSKSEILNKAVEIHTAISDVYSKASDDIAKNKLKNEFIALRDAIRPSFAPSRKKPSARIQDTMDSLSTKPDASNQVIVGATDKAYMQGELPLGTVREVRNKLSQAIDEEYVPKRGEAIEVAKGAPPAASLEEHVANMEEELRAAGMRVPNFEATPEQVAEVDTKRAQTESAVVGKHLAKTAGITEKMQESFAQKSDAQQLRLQEQTNRILNANRAEQLAAGTRAMKRFEQERVAGRKQDVIEAFKAERQAQRQAVELAKAKEAAAKYLEQEDLAAQRESAKSLERQKKGENIQRQADVVRLAERRRGMTEALKEQSAQQRAEKRAAKEAAAQPMPPESKSKAEAIDKLLKEAKTASVGPTTSKGTQVIDERIPKKTNIVISPKMKFRIYLNSGGLIGITDTYEQAIKTAKRRAA